MYRCLSHCRRRSTVVALADCALRRRPCRHADGTCGRAGRRRRRRADAGAGATVVGVVVDTATIVGMAVDEAAVTIVVVVAVMVLAAGADAVLGAYAGGPSCLIIQVVVVNALVNVGVVVVNVSAVVVTVILMVVVAPGAATGAVVLVRRLGVPLRSCDSGCPRVMAIVVHIDEPGGCGSAPSLKENSRKCDRGVFSCGGGHTREDD